MKKENYNKKDNSYNEKSNRKSKYFEDAKKGITHSDDNESCKEENVTMYGETVCTQFAWLPLDKQKENTERFNNITKNK